MHVPAGARAAEARRHPARDVRTAGRWRVLRRALPAPARIDERRRRRLITAAALAGSGSTSAFRRLACTGRALAPIPTASSDSFRVAPSRRGTWSRVTLPHSAKLRWGVHRRPRGGPTAKSRGHRGCGVGRWPRRLPVPAAFLPGDGGCAARGVVVEEAGRRRARRFPNVRACSRTGGMYARPVGGEVPGSFGARAARSRVRRLRDHRNPGHAASRRACPRIRGACVHENRCVTTRFEGRDVAASPRAVDALP